MNPATGKASWYPEAGILKIATDAKRGKKIVQHVTFYTVRDSRPDFRVANPSYELRKIVAFDMDRIGELAYLESLQTSESYHVSIRDGIAYCDCGHYTFRGSNSREACKHIRSLTACGFFNLEAENGNSDSCAG